MKASSSALPVNNLLWVIPFVVLFLLAYSSSITTVMTAWNAIEAEGSSHGWLVLVCTLYLLWLKKDTLFNLPLQPSWVALIFLIGAALLWFLTSVIQVQAGQMAVLPLLILMGIGALCGPRHLLVALIPISLLFFALPIWQPLLPILQDITTAVTHFNLKLIGRPVYVIDNYVHVSGGSFIIEEACSGLRFMLVSTTLSFMNSALNRHTWRQTLMMFSIGLALSFVANWVRVIVVILLGDFTQMKHPWVADHANLGWVIYLVFVLIPFFIINRYVQPPAETTEDNNEAVSSAVTLDSRKRTVQILAVIALFIAPLGFRWLGATTDAGAVNPMFPQQLSEWRAMQGTPTGAWRPAFLNTTALLDQSYQRGSEAPLRAHIAYYAKQDQGVELINVNNGIVDAVKWHIEPASEGVATPGGNLVVKTATVIGSGGRERVWYWYDVGGYSTSNNYMAKAYQVPAFLRGRSDATLVAISTKCGADCTDQDAVLGDFFAAIPDDFAHAVSGGK